MMEGTRNSHMRKQSGFPKAGRAISCEMLLQEMKRRSNLGCFVFLPLMLWGFLWEGHLRIGISQTYCNLQ